MLKPQECIHNEGVKSTYNSRLPSHLLIAHHGHNEDIAAFTGLTQAIEQDVVPNRGCDGRDVYIVRRSHLKKQHACVCFEGFEASQIVSDLLLMIAERCF